MTFFGSDPDPAKGFGSATLMRTVKRVEIKQHLASKKIHYITAFNFEAYSYGPNKLSHSFCGP